VAKHDKCNDFLARWRTGGIAISWPGRFFCEAALARPRRPSLNQKKERRTMSLVPVLARVCLIGLFTPAVALALSPPDPEWVAKVAETTERQRSSFDNAIGSLVRDGMALLVIPTINLDAGGQRNFDDAATREKFLRQQSLLMRWNHKTERDYAITTGHGKHKLDHFDLGPQFQTPNGAITYQVIPVWPGEYRLNVITYRQPGATTPNGTRSWTIDEALEEVGVSTLIETTDIGYKKTGPWPQYEKATDDGLGEGCEVVVRLGGGCDEAAREFRWQRSAQRGVEAGTAEELEVRGMTVQLHFAPIASITLKEGEVVLTDGFVLMDGQPVLNMDKCQKTARDTMCLIQSLTVQRLPASIENFRQAPSATSFKMPKMDELLRGMVYRKPTVYGKPIDKASPNVIEAFR